MSDPVLVTRIGHRYEEPIRRFRRQLFSQAGDTTDALLDQAASPLPVERIRDGIASTRVADIIASNPPIPPGLGPLNALTDRFLMFTVSGDFIDQSVLCEDPSLTGSVLTLSIAAHHRTLRTRQAVPAEEAEALIRAILDNSWADQMYTDGTVTGHGPGGRLTTVYYRLFLTSDGHATTPPASYPVSLTRLTAVGTESPAAM